MRILATADLQLGKGADYLVPKYGPGSRLADHEKAWVDACNLAIKHDVGAVIVAGDVFEDKRPGPPAYRAFQAGLSILRGHRIPVVIVAGNHDVRAADETSAIEIFDDDRVHVHRRPSTGHLGDGVGYAVLPWTTMGTLAAQEEGGDRDFLHYKASEYLAQAAADLHDQLAGSRHRILIAHWAVSSAAMPTGKLADDLPEPVIPLDQLAEQGWDMIVLGHLHRAQNLGSPEQPIVYCGSPLPCDHGEASYQHGCWLLDLDETKAATFLPIESRPFVTVDVRDVDGAIVPDGAIVRVVGKITETENDQVDQDAIKRALIGQGASSVRFGVDVERSIRARDDRVTSDLCPKAALDAWIEAARPDVDHDLLRSLHARYLEQEHAA